MSALRLELYAIPLTALVISIMTLFFTSMAMRKKADGDYVESLERRLARVEKDLEECTAERSNLTRENIELLRKLAGQI